MARFTGGWVKLHREVLDKDIHQNLILWGIWNHLLIIAVYKETQLLWMGKQRVLHPGQCVFGIKELAEKWEISRSVIQKWLHYLHDTGRIVFESCSRGSIVTICNWEHYQVSEDEACSPRVNGVLTACSPRVNGEALSEEVKKERKKEEKKDTRFDPVETLPEFLVSGKLEPLFQERQVTAETQRAWLNAYPDAAWIEKEILKAMAWESANPLKRKKNLSRFITSWLSRSDWDTYRAKSHSNSKVQLKVFTNVEDHPGYASDKN